MNSFCTSAATAKIDLLLGYLGLSAKDQAATKAFLRKRTATFGPLLHTPAVVKLKEAGLIHHLRFDDGHIHPTAVFSVAVTTNWGWELLLKRNHSIKTYVDAHGAS